MDAKGEVLITIMASLAQQESQSLSHNVKLGLQYRYQRGKGQVNHNRFMGQTKDEDGNLIFVPKEAEIIKRIYREYLEGKSLACIGRELEKDGILTVAGKQRWRPETIKKILLNDKYIGDALLQKTFTVDFHTKKRVKNEGHAPQNFNKKLKRETVNLDELKAIADALDIKFEQVFILHDGNKIKTGNE